MKKTTILLVIVSWAMLGCSNAEKLDDSIEKLGRATGPVGAAPGDAVPQTQAMGGGAARAAGPAAILAGEVQEAINVPNYSYLRVKTEDGEMWAAIPQGTYEVGQKVEISQSLVMEKFTSPSLGRTFDAIVFGTIKGDAPAGGGAPASGPTGGGMPAGHPPVGVPADAPADAPAAAMPPGHPPTGAAAEPSADEPDDE